MDDDPVEQSKHAYVSMRMAKSLFDEKVEQAKDNLVTRVRDLVNLLDTNGAVKKLYLYKNGDVSVCENCEGRATYTLSTDTGQISVEIERVCTLQIDSLCDLLPKRQEFAQFAKDADLAGVFQSIDPEDEDLGIEIDMDEEEEEGSHAKKVKSNDEVDE